jgi:predicted MFS family arabinose efflux permease
MAALARFLIVLAAAIAAAATIGKLVPHVDRLAADLDVPLGAAGFLVSAVMLPGALAGPLLGLAVDRLGPRRVALFGFALQACASLAGGYAGSFAALAATRVLEGFGYGLAIVASTVLVVEVSRSHRRALALAVWSAFAPIGFALGQLFGGGAGGANPLPSIGIAHALVLGALALLVAVALPESARQHGARPSFLATLRSRPALGTSLAFGLATGALLGAVAVAPLVIAGQHGLTVAAAAQLTALAALPGIAGRFASGWLLGSARPIGIFVLASVAGSGFLAAGLVLPISLAAALACFAAFQICVGALPGVMSAMLPRVASSPEQLGTVSGLATQMITAGNLLAPPLALSIYAWSGAAGTAAALIAAVGLSAGLVGALPVYRERVAPS